MSPLRFAPRETYRTCFYVAFLPAIATLMLPAVSYAQADRGSIAGTVTDGSQAVLQGARIVLQPGGQAAVSGADGRYILPGVKPGHYTVQVSYLGFDSLSKDVDVTAGAVGKLDAVLSVGNETSNVTVRPEREVGEAEALNRQRVATNIVQVLPSELINSLPNVNIADAVGRLPSVSLERDEGEGKYVQIRGTEPRLTSVTVDGIELPSPENVRFVKLDTIPADLVESIELNKTLTASMNGDGIGGSLNLVTRQATDQPYFAIEGLFGHTPINGLRSTNQEFATYGRRFLADKKLGFLITGSYDYNGRGINDIEPSPGINTFTNPDGTTGTVDSANAIDIRNYFYDRSRYGLGGTLDYKLDERTSVYFKGLYSYLSDFGEDSIKTFNTGAFTSATTTDRTGSTAYQELYRRPAQQLFSALVGGDKSFGTSNLSFKAALSQARITGGFDDVSFNGIAPTTDIAGNTNQDGVAFNTATNNPFLPGFRVTSTRNNVSVNDPNQYPLSDISFQNNDTFERDVAGQADYTHAYSAAQFFGVWQAGFKARDVIKNQLFNQSDATYIGNGLNLGSFPANRDTSNYYFGVYQPGPQAQAANYIGFFNANAQQFSVDPETARNLRSDFHVSEREYAGYLENTLTYNRYVINTGVRVESTSNGVQGFQPDPTGAILPVFTTNNYVYVLPSASIKYNQSNYTDYRLAFSIGLSRPNYGDLAPFVQFTPQNSGTASNPQLQAGNPGLTATYSENIDALGEHYFHGIGVIQGGVFYKQIFNDIFNSVVSVPYVLPGATQPTNLLERLPINGGSSHLIGAEASWEQQLKRLPGALGGAGFRFNYSYVASVAGVPGRSDHPALQRDAPNNFNVDLTFDKYGISARMGLTHNDANIAAYQFTDGTPIAGSPTNVSDGGLKGPNGDNYFYPHTQVDTQISYLVPKGHGVSVIGQFLNLNNEVFGFYNGSERFPVQREYYSPTYTFGLRWTSDSEHGSVFHN